MFSFLTNLWRTKPLVVVICGPTASGKTGLSLQVAKSLTAQGVIPEIISADSRQIYRSIPIFSGAIQPQEMQGFTHHLVGTEDPAETHSVEWFRSSVKTTLDHIIMRGNLPIVVGGSGFWVQSLLFQDVYPEVRPNPVLRKTLGLLSTRELYDRLKTLDPRRAQSIDRYNPRRLVRAIEIATELGSVPVPVHNPQSDYRTLVVYIDPPKEQSDKKIEDNVRARINQGLIQEAQALQGDVSPERMRELGLAYKHIASYLKGEMSLEEYIHKVVKEEQHYAKRQRTLFKKILDTYKGECIRVTGSEQDLTQRVVTHIRKMI